MEWTRLSLFYLFGYLTFGGAGLMASPDSFLALFWAHAHYGPVMPRIVGMLMLSLAIMVLQVIRLRAESLYTTTLIVRGFLAVSMLGFYLAFGEPMFLIVLGIIFLGVSLTVAGLVADRASAAASKKSVR